MAEGTLISTANSVVDPYSPDTTPHVFQFSDGWMIALFRQNSSSVYALRNGAGAWQTPIALATDYLARAHSCRQVGDVISIWTVHNAPPATITQVKLSYNTGTNAVTVSSATKTQGTSLSLISTYWHSTSSYWYVAVADGHASTILSLTDGTLTTGATVSGPSDTSFNTMHMAGPSPTSTTVFLVKTGNSDSVTPITPGLGGSITVGTGENPAAFNATGGCAYAFDESNLLNLFFIKGGGPYPVRHIKRTGTNTYSSSTDIYANTNITTGTPICTTVNGSTGDIWVAFKSTITRSNGQIILVKRIGGNWTSGVVVAGISDNTGYGSVTSMPALDNASQGEFLYANGTSTYGVRNLALTNSHSPDIPTTIAPAGTYGDTATTPTPTFSFGYSNSLAPNDTQGAYQILVKRQSDNVSMWDSGKVSSGTNTVAYGGSTLTYGIAYYWQVQVWDSILDTTSGYSATQTFTPQVAPDSSVYQLVSPTGGTLGTGGASSTLNGSTLANATSLAVQTGHGVRFGNGRLVAVGTSPNIDLVTIGTIATDTLPVTGRYGVTGMAHAHSSGQPVVEVDTTFTLTAPSLDAVIEVQQASGHNVSAYNLQLLDITGTIVVQETGMQSIAPVAPGSTITVSNWAIPNAANNTTFKLRAKLTDATTSLVGTGQSATVSTAYPPPSPITGLVPKTDSDNGYVRLSWSNPGGIASNTIQWRKSGATAWTTIASGSLRTSIKVYAPLQTAYDYNVLTVDNSGIPSNPTIVSDISLGLKFGKLGVWLNSSSTPANAAPLGWVQDWSSATNWTHVKDRNSFTPAGRKKPITVYGKTDFWRASGRKYWVPAIDGSGSNTLTLTDIYTALEGFETTAEPIQYRDITGILRFVDFSNYGEVTDEAVHGIVSFDLEEQDTTLVVLTV